MIIQVDFGSAQTGVGYQFYDEDGTLLGSRVTSGISAVASPTAGVYVADATVPAGAVGVAWDSTETTTAAIEDLREALTTVAIKAKTDILSSGTVTILGSVAQNGGTLTFQAGDTLSWSFADLGALTGYADIVFAIHPPYASADDDSDAALYLSEANGLTRVQQAAYATTTDGSITVDDEATGDITLTVADEASLLLRGVPDAVWSVKVLRADGTSATLSAGPCVINRPKIHTTA